jgi:hypothetical protein
VVDGRVNRLLGGAGQVRATAHQDGRGTAWQRRVRAATST